MIGLQLRKYAVAPAVLIASEVFFGFSSGSLAAVVKKSKSSICHCPGGRYYDRTKRYTPYRSIGDCLASGGRHPKGGQGDCAKVKSNDTKRSSNKVMRRSLGPVEDRSGKFPCFGHKVVDGDTMEIVGFRVRLHGIDAPESHQSCLDSRGKIYRCGMEATAAVSLLAAGGVSCTVEGETDRYGRKIATCFSAHGTNINKWMVRYGHAVAYRKYSMKYVSEEDKARAEGRGIHRGRFIPPWDWRRGKRLH